MLTSLLIGFAGLVVAVGLAALLLHLRDRLAKAQGKTVAQFQAPFFAILQLRATLEYSILGVLTVIGGIFWVLDRSRQHESDWWYGLPLIPAGWVFIVLLTRRSWCRYLELRRVAERAKGEPSGGRPYPPEID